MTKDFDKVFADPPFEYHKEEPTKKNSIYNKEFNLKQSIIILGSVVGVIGVAVVFLLGRIN